MTLSQRLLPLLEARLGHDVPAQDLLVKIPGLKLHGLRHALQGMAGEIVLFAVPDPAARNPLLLVRRPGTACPAGAVPEIPCGPDAGVLYAATPDLRARRGKAGFSTNPARRLLSIFPSRADTRHVARLRAHPNARQAEALLHAAGAPLVERGREWYRIPHQARATCAEMLAFLVDGAADAADELGAEGCHDPLRRAQAAQRLRARLGAAFALALPVGPDAPGT
jgi:hypothetical protein